MAGTVNHPSAPRSERRTPDRIVGLFCEALGYRDREQAMTPELLSGHMRLIEQERAA